LLHHPFCGRDARAPRKGTKEIIQVTQATHFPYDAILFDLDGTLFDAEQGIISSIKFAMNRLGEPVPGGVDLRACIGPPLFHSFVSLLCLSPDKAREAMQLYREHFEREGMDQYTVYPHIRSILQILKSHQIYVALATSKPTSIAREILDRFGLTRYFSKIVGVDDDNRVIDKPELVRLALPETYARAAMVGDRFYDMEGAAANRIEGIGAGYGFGSEAELYDAGAAHIAPTTEALRSLLCGDAKLPRGFFLTMEGPDGSGKSTQVALLEKNLRSYGFDVLFTREPGGCVISEEIRSVVLDPEHKEMSRECEALLYAAARAQHVHQVIRPAVERGMLVLCDRFVDSSVAYQGGGRELGVETVQRINAPAVAEMRPDATVYLAIDHRIGLKRRYGASTPDRLELEGVEFHARVQEAYEKLIREDPDRFLVVNADQGIEAVARETLGVVLRRLEEC